MQFELTVRDTARQQQVISKIHQYPYYNNSQQQGTRGCRPQRPQRRARPRGTPREALRLREEGRQRRRQELGLPQTIVKALLHTSSHPRHAKRQNLNSMCTA